MSDCKPILFDSTSIRAILDGHKTQTRRVIKPQPPSYLEGRAPTHIAEDLWGFMAGGDKASACRSDDTIRCPYGAPGDELWVRETWRIGAWMDGLIAVDYKADGHARREWLEGATEEQYERYVHQSIEDAKKAGLSFAESQLHWPPGEGPTRWRPSIHMCRWMSRITLEITDVRAERLKDIDEADARAEGIRDGGCENCGESSYPDPCGCDDPTPLYVDAFAFRWFQIHGEESWWDNPWVWVLEFEVVE